MEKSADNCKECEFKENKQTVAKVVRFGEYVEKAQKKWVLFSIFSNVCSQFYVVPKENYIFCVVQGIERTFF